MKTFFLVIALLLIRGVAAQDTTRNEEKKSAIRFTGFVKSDYWYDSRQVVAAR
jgi:hypothetical protein